MNKYFIFPLHQSELTHLHYVQINKKNYYFLDSSHISVFFLCVNVAKDNNNNVKNYMVGYSMLQPSFNFNNPIIFESYRNSCTDLTVFSIKYDMGYDRKI